MGALFGESLGRILVSVKEESREEFEVAMTGHACHHLGTVIEGDEITFSNNGEEILVTSMSEARSAWKKALDGGGA